MKSPLAFALSLGLLPTLLSSQNLLTVGAPAPAIHVSEWIANQPADTSLRGKPMVLEFWATWCGPCIGAVPHLNELQETFGSQGVGFVSITDEPVGKVQRTLARVNFSSAVVTDLTGETQRRFGDGERLRAFPMTVLIDAAGLVQWVGEPEKLTENVMTAFLAGTLKGKNAFTEGAAAKTGDGTDVTYSVSEDFMRLIKDRNALVVFRFGYSSNVATESSMMVTDLNKRLYTGLTLAEVFAKAFDKEVTPPADLGDYTYDLLFVHHDEDPVHLAQAETQVLQSLGLRLASKRIPREFTVVTMADSSRLGTATESPFASVSDADGQLLIDGFTLAKAIEMYAESTGSPIIYGGAGSARYDLILSTESEESLLRDLESYGLQTRRETREVEVFDLIK